VTWASAQRTRRGARQLSVTACTFDHVRYGAMNQKSRAMTLAVAGAAGLAILATAPQAEAMMAGQPPDSPTARVDANVPGSPYAGVGSVVVGGSPLSGVVIAAQYVLTAGHVVSGQAPSNIQFVLNLNGSTQWTSTVDSVSTYPTFNFPYDDLAVLKLTKPVPDNVPVYSIYSGPISTGLLITLVGYGGSGNGNTGVTVGASSAVKRSGGNVVDALQPTVDNSGLTSKFYLYDFDGPTGNGPLGGPTTGNSVETLVAVGDSGSPAFVHNGAVLQLFGINTFVSTPGGGAANYEFGTAGGGIVASDPRFASWLQTATAGTLGQAPFTADGPLPLWCDALLAGLLGSILVLQLRGRSPA
jgi:Trypsin